METPPVHVLLEIQGGEVVEADAEISTPTVTESSAGDDSDDGSPAPESAPPSPPPPGAPIKVRTVGGREAIVLERRQSGWFRVELDGNANDEGGARERKDIWRTTFAPGQDHLLEAAPLVVPRVKPSRPLPPATRPHVASTASAWVAACTDLLEAAKDRTNMRGLREPLVSRGFQCGLVHQNGSTFEVTVPPDFPCYYDVVGKDYVHQDRANSMPTLRKYLEGALALARAGGAYRTDAEYKQQRRLHDTSNRADHRKTSRFTGVAWKENCGKWRAQISVRRSQIELGLFDDEEDAARAYDAALVKYRGAPTLNFPREAPLASVLAALPAAPSPPPAPLPRPARALAPRVIVDPEAPMLMAHHGRKGILRHKKKRRRGEGRFAKKEDSEADLLELIGALEGAVSPPSAGELQLRRELKQLRRENKRLKTLTRPGWIGAYSPEARKRRIARFHGKRARRVWTKPPPRHRRAAPAAARSPKDS